MGQDIYDCHSKESFDGMENLLKSVKTGEKNLVRLWVGTSDSYDGGKRKALIEYHALRDPEGKYLGCLEVAYNVAELKALISDES